MSRKLTIIVLCVTIFFIAIGENRHFYCLDNNRCITVWKTYGNTCFVIQGKYYGFIKPIFRNYIVTTNDAELDLIWADKPETIIANSNNKMEIINNQPKTPFINYYLQKKRNDSLYLHFEGRYEVYNKNLRRIVIIIRDNYALDQNGNEL